MNEKLYYTVDDIVKETGVNRNTIYTKIKEGKLVPYNQEDRYMDGGSYLFTQEEFERAKAMFEKPGLTIKETADLLGLSPSLIRILVNKGVLKGVKRPYGGRMRVYILEESVEAYLAEHDEQIQDIHYLNETGFFLYQPVLVNGTKGRIVRLGKDGTGEVELETGEMVTLEAGKIKPLKQAADKDYINKKGKIVFDFPKPKHINHIVYDIIVRLFGTVGPKNLQIKSRPQTITVQTKPCAIDIDHHHEEVAMMQSCLREGKLIKRSQGILLISNVTSVAAEITLDEKSKIKDLIKKGKYESISDFVNQAIKEKLDRENG